MAAQSPGSRSLGAIVDGRYSLEKVIGSGAMGVVYLARDLNLDRPLALKLIARELAQDPQTIARFRREAQALATVKHQHVVQVYAYGPHDGAYFFAMEFIDGETLDHMMTSHGSPLPLQTVTSILRAVASGLGAVHAKKLVHRDVKPGNIVVENGTGRPVLVDFGLAANVRPTDGRTSFVGGTPYYMAPEQIKAGEDNAIPPGPAADQYALACMTFELLTGRPPFESANVTAILSGHLHRTPPLLSATHPDLAAIDEPLQRALAKRPEDRFESCEAFIAALEPAFGTVTSPIIEAPVAAQARLVLADQTEPPSQHHPTLDPSALQASIPKRSGPALFILGGVAVLVATLGYAAVRATDKSDATKTAAAGDSHPTTSAITPIPPPPSATTTATSIDVAALPQASARPTATTIAAKLTPISHPPTTAVAPPPVTAVAAPQPTTPPKPKSAYDEFGERK
jgi:serine/threonine-protein kinase